MHLYYGIDYNIAKINKNMTYSNFQQIISLIPQHFDLTLFISS